MDLVDRNQEKESMEAVAEVFAETHSQSARKTGQFADFVKAVAMKSSGEAISFSRPEMSAAMPQILESLSGVFDRSSIETADVVNLLCDHVPNHENHRDMVGSFISPEEMNQSVLMRAVADDASKMFWNGETSEHVGRMVEIARAGIEERAAIRESESVVGVELVAEVSPVVHSATVLSEHDERGGGR